VRIVEQVEALGEVRYRDRTAEDVTDQVTDVEARVATQRASIARLRVLLEGWDAFLEVALVALTVAGALLPFALAAGLVLVPLALALRARGRSRATPADRPAPAPPG
jgi:hypothetical protein